MKHLISLIISCFLAGAAFAQKDTVAYTGDPGRDISAFLRAGVYLVDHVTFLPPKKSEREITLENKVNKAMMANLKWFTDTFPQMKEPPGNYYEKLGLTKEEFEEYSKSQDATPKREIHVTGHDSLAILKSGNLISFKGQGRLRVLDSLQFDLAHNAALYKRLILDYKAKESGGNKHEITTPEVGGYTYEYEEGGPGAGNDMNFSMTNYQLMIGKAYANGRLLVIFTALEVDNGKTKIRIVLPFEYDPSTP